MRRQRLSLRWMGIRILHELQLELTAGLDHSFGAGRVAFAGQLHENLIVIATVKLDRGLC